MLDDHVTITLDLPLDLITDTIASGESPPEYNDVAVIWSTENWPMAPDVRA